MPHHRCRDPGGCALFYANLCITLLPCFNFYMTQTTARQFLDEIAAGLRAKGREVTVTETQESFGTFVWLSAPAPRWFDYSITLSAAKSNRPGSRWRLGRMMVRGGLSKEKYATTRRSVKICADVYS